MVLGKSEEEKSWNLSKWVPGTKSEESYIYCRVRLLVIANIAFTGTIFMKNKPHFDVDVFLVSTVFFNIFSVQFAYITKLNT
jgi:hypothetical protein